MDVKQQYAFIDELQDMFLEKDRDFLRFETYEGEYGQIAAGLDEVLATLGKLIQSDKR